MKTNHLIFSNILNFVRIIYMYVSTRTDYRLPLSMFSVPQFTVVQVAAGQLPRRYTPNSKHTYCILNIT